MGRPLSSHEGGGYFPWGVGFRPPGGGFGSLFGNGRYSENVIVAGAVLQPTTVQVAGESVIPALSALTGGGWIVSASSSYNASTRPVWKCFNGVGAQTTSAAWAAATSTGSVVMAAPAKQRVSGYVLTPNTASAPAYLPKDFTLSGSDDGLEWTVVDARTGVTNWVNSTPKTFILNEESEYAFFKLSVTSITSGTYLILSQVALLGGNTLLPDTLFIDDAATICPHPATGSSVLQCNRLEIAGASAVLSSSEASRGLIVIARQGIVLTDGGRIHADRLGFPGSPGPVSLASLIPPSVARNLRLASLLPYVLSARGANGGTGVLGATNAGAAAGFMQTGGGGSGAGYGSWTTPGKGGCGGPLCGGSGGGGGAYPVNGVSTAGGAGEDFGGRGGDGGVGDATHCGGGGSGSPPGAGVNNAVSGVGPGGGMIALIAPFIDIGSGCVVSADGSPAPTMAMLSGGATGGGNIVFITLAGGLINMGTARAAGGAASGSYHGGVGGDGSINPFTV